MHLVLCLKTGLIFNWLGTTLIFFSGTETPIFIWLIAKWWSHYCIWKSAICRLLLAQIGHCVLFSKLINIIFLFARKVWGGVVHHVTVNHSHYLWILRSDSCWYSILWMLVDKLGWLDNGFSVSKWVRLAVNRVIVHVLIWYCRRLPWHWCFSSEVQEISLIFITINS